jgi:hypothetical protein
VRYVWGRRFDGEGKQDFPSQVTGGWTTLEAAITECPRNIGGVLFINYGRIKRVLNTLICYHVQLKSSC